MDKSSAVFQAEFFVLFRHKNELMPSEIKSAKVIEHPCVWNAFSELTILFSPFSLSATEPEPAKDILV
jgi:hypothetical protein